MFCVPSLSARTIIYKGPPLAPQIAKFYKELSDPDLTSASSVHQRFSTIRSPRGIPVGLFRSCGA